MARPYDNPQVRVFKTAIKRARSFLTGGKKGKGPRAKDRLRASVVFGVAAIDTYCRLKILYALRRRRSAKGFELPDSVAESLRNHYAMRDHKMGYAKLSRHHRDMIDSHCNSKKPSVLNDLERVLRRTSFQSVDDLKLGLDMMSLDSKGVWSRMENGLRDKATQSGRKPGKPTKYDVQLRDMFERRHQIVHNADLKLSRKGRGGSFPISYTTTTRWIDNAEKVVLALDRVIEMVLKGT